MGSEGSEGLKVKRYIGLRFKAETQYEKVVSRSKSVCCRSKIG